MARSGRHSPAVQSRAAFRPREKRDEPPGVADAAAQDRSTANGHRSRGAPVRIWRVASSTAASRFGPRERGPGGSRCTWGSRLGLQSVTGCGFGESSSGPTRCRRSEPKRDRTERGTGHSTGPASDGPRGGVFRARRCEPSRVGTGSSDSRGNGSVACRWCDRGRGRWTGDGRPGRPRSGRALGWCDWIGTWAWGRRAGSSVVGHPTAPAGLTRPR